MSKMTVDNGSAEEADAGEVTWDVMWHCFAALLLHPNVLPMCC